MSGTSCSFAAHISHYTPLTLSLLFSGEPAWLSLLGAGIHLFTAFISGCVLTGCALPLCELAVQLVVLSAAELAMQLLMYNPCPNRSSCGALQSSEDVCAGHNAHQLRLAVYHRDAVHLRTGILSYPYGFHRCRYFRGHPTLQEQQHRIKTILAWCNIHRAPHVTCNLLQHCLPSSILQQQPFSGYQVLSTWASGVHCAVYLSMRAVLCKGALMQARWVRKHETRARLPCA